jgi:hypothetical protein
MASPLHTRVMLEIGSLDEHGRPARAVPDEHDVE